MSSALVLGDRDDAAAAQFREAADHRGIVAEVAVAVQFVELIERGDVGRAERPLRMARHVDALPRRERAEDLELDLRVLLLERLDLGAEIDRLIGGVRFEIGDALLEFEQTAFAFDDRVHTLLAAGASVAVRRCRRYRAPRAGAVVEQANQQRAQFRALDDHVDRAVFEQELGGLKIVGQFLADRLLDHAPSGETDRRARFGDDDVGLKRERRRDAAGRRIGEHGDRVAAVVAKTLQRDGGLRHLHQREHAFFHARAARRRAHDDRQLALARAFEQAREAFADDGAHRAAAKVEVHHAQRDRQIADRGEAAHDAFGELRFLAVALELLRIRRLVGPAQRIARNDLGADLDEVGIDQHRDAIERVHAKVMFARRAHEQILREVRPVEHRRALRTLRPLRCIFERLLRSAPDPQPLRNHGRPKSRPR